MSNRQSIDFRVESNNSVQYEDRGYSETVAHARNESVPHSIQFEEEGSKSPAPVHHYSVDRASIQFRQENTNTNISNMELPVPHSSPPAPDTVPISRNSRSSADNAHPSDGESLMFQEELPSASAARNSIQFRYADESSPERRHSSSPVIVVPPPPPAHLSHRAEERARSRTCPPPSAAPRSRARNSTFHPPGALPPAAPTATSSTPAQINAESKAAAVYDSDARSGTSTAKVEDVTSQSPYAPRDDSVPPAPVPQTSRPKAAPAPTARPPLAPGGEARAAQAARSVSPGARNYARSASAGSEFSSWGGSEMSGDDGAPAGPANAIAQMQISEHSGTLEGTQWEYVLEFTSDAVERSLVNDAAAALGLDPSFLRVTQLSATDDGKLFATLQIAHEGSLTEDTIHEKLDACDYPSTMLLHDISTKPSTQQDSGLGAALRGMGEGDRRPAPVGESGSSRALAEKKNSDEDSEEEEPEEEPEAPVVPYVETPTAVATRAPPHSFVKRVGDGLLLLDFKNLHDAADVEAEPLELFFEGTAADWNVAQLRASVGAFKGIAPKYLTLYYAGRQLSDAETGAQLELINGSVLDVRYDRKAAEADEAREEAKVEAAIAQAKREKAEREAPQAAQAAPMQQAVAKKKTKEATTATTKKKTNGAAAANGAPEKKKKKLIKKKKPGQGVAAPTASSAGKVHNDGPAPEKPKKKKKRAPTHPAPVHRRSRKEKAQHEDYVVSRNALKSRPVPEDLLTPRAYAPRSPRPGADVVYNGAPAPLEGGSRRSLSAESRRSSVSRRSTTTGRRTSVRAPPSLSADALQGGPGDRCPPQQIVRGIRPTTPRPVIARKHGHGVANNSPRDSVRNGGTPSVSRRSHSPLRHHGLPQTPPPVAAVEPPRAESGLDDWAVESAEAVAHPPLTVPQAEAAYDYAHSYEYANSSEAAEEESVIFEEDDPLPEEAPNPFV